MHVWRDRLNRWLAPVASRIPLSPNSITIFALIVNLGAAWLLATARSRPLLFLLAASAIAGSGILDILDGAVARAQTRISRFGDFLDHLCDRMSDVAILAGWSIGAEIRAPAAIAAIIAVMLNGYIGTQIEATFGRRTHTGTGRGEFVLAAVTFPLLQFALVRAQFDRMRLGGLTIAEWLTAVIVLFATLGILERFQEARRLGKEIR